MTAGSGERRARVALSFLADPGDTVLGAALGALTAADVLAAAATGGARLVAAVNVTRELCLGC